MTTADVVIGCAQIAVTFTGVGVLIGWAIFR